jgi:putative peptidoglycan lipid II flippase
MLKKLFSVGGWTLVSRVTGFLRDLVMAQVLGAGALMDLFALAFRLPNHFRAIFAEGAFSASFVPAYTRLRSTEGAAASDVFQGRLLTILLLSQALLLVAALAFTPQVVGLLGLPAETEPQRFATAVELVRITFPYLALITLVTLWSGALNAIDHYGVAAAAPVLLNLSLIGAMALAAWFITPAHAAAWGVAVAGVLEALLLLAAAWRAGVLARPRWPRLGAAERGFFAAFFPGVIGAAGVQIAMFADTIIAQGLAVGSASALYYADRLYQLPMGVIAIAAGTVLLPTMSRKLAEGDAAGASRVQNRVMGLVLMLAAPCWVASLLIPDVVIRAAFLGGAFTPEAARRAADVLCAYGVGLVAAVLIRSVVASFHARGDTRTPMVISLVAVAGNLALKLAITPVLGVAGLALATAVGAIANLAALMALAGARGWFLPDRGLAVTALAVLAAALAMAVIMIASDPMLARLSAQLGIWPSLVHLAGHALSGLAYLAVLALLLRVLRPGRGGAAAAGAV